MLVKVERDCGPPNGKFVDPEVTASGEVRASVTLDQLKIVWFNTGSLCNIACEGCYIESTPTNERLSYLTIAEVRSTLDEIARERLPVEEIGFTGGEPFLNRDFPLMLEDALGRGFRVLVLTNAMKPMQRHRPRLAALVERFGTALTVRVSLDHYTREGHEEIRGPGTWEPAMAGLRWLSAAGINVHVASRTVSGEDDERLRAGFKDLFLAEGIAVDTADPRRLVLFPEMDKGRDVPEITVRCWDILGVRPASMMCASQRMVIKRRGAQRPAVVPCTLLPYDSQFELGSSLAGAAKTVKLNHPFCAQFCVLGGASCARSDR